MQRLSILFLVSSLKKKIIDNKESIIFQKLNTLNHENALSETITIIFSYTILYQWYERKNGDVLYNKEYLYYGSSCVLWKVCLKKEAFLVKERTDKKAEVQVQEEK